MVTATLPRAAALGALMGAGWGVLARIWMRLISTDPEFSWTGTLLIIGFAALLGGGVGLAAGARLAGRSRWWTLAVLPGLALFLSPGMLLAPSFVLGSLAYGQRGRILHAVGWTVIGLSIVGSARLVVVEPEPGTETTPGLVITFLIGFSLMAITLAWAGSHIWRPRPRSPLTNGSSAERQSASTALPLRGAPTSQKSELM
jgi:hypothetical protein